MARKSAELAPLLRVQGWTVDEQRRMLGQLLGREEALRDDLAALDRELIAEQQVAAQQPILAGHSYAAYAAGWRDRRIRLEGVLGAVRQEIEQQRERLAAAFRELKVLEQVQGNWRDEERINAARLEQNAMDEIAENLTRAKTAP